MKKNRILHRKNPDSDDSIEKLKGKLRELAKQLEAEKRYSRSLEKQLRKIDHTTAVKNPSDSEKVHKKPTQEIEVELCKQCGGENTMEETVIHSPSKPLVWRVCRICLHKERQK